MEWKGWLPRRAVLVLTATAVPIQGQPDQKICNYLQAAKNKGIRRCSYCLARGQCSNNTPSRRVHKKHYHQKL